MELTDSHYARLVPLLPVQRGNVKIDNRQLLNALLYIAENGGKWRRLPKEYGNWHTIYTRLRRWAQHGVLDRIFEALQRQRLIAIRIECLSLDSTSIKVHPDATGALKKGGGRRSASPEADGTPKFIGLPRMIERL
jgi:transposase